MKRAADDFSRIEVYTRADLRAWLQKHHAQKDSVWLVTYKSGSPHYFPYGEIVDEALCFGWIDSLPRTLDATRTMRLLSPRKDRSAWSAVNQKKVEALMAAGLMAPSGLAAIERAKASGRWSALTKVEALETPADLSKALKASLAAQGHWDSFPRSAKRAILEWIHIAKSPETRAKRIAETVKKAARGERANQWRQPKTPRTAKT